MSKSPYPLSTKPDLADAARRWEAYLAGDIVDRPIVCVTARHPGATPPPYPDYHDKAFGDIDEFLDRVLADAEATYWGGEAVPGFGPSSGPDEIAAFVGAEFRWSADSSNTNWSTPFVEDWDDALPLRFQKEGPLWQRMLAIYRRGAERLAGKVLLVPPDLHTNMDLLAAIRGPERLCMDLVERPEAIDRAMVSARALFRELWDTVVEAGRMNEYGFVDSFYSMEGSATLACDFSALIGPAMFRRWVLPALEEEAEIVHHAFYHWDGPGALKHRADIVASRGLHTIGYVPTLISVPGERDRHIDHLDLYKQVQAAGKGVYVSGTPEELKLMHRELRPEKTMYATRVSTPDEADALLEWFVKNT